MNPFDRFIEALPQQKPFLFLDELTALDHGASARGRKTFPPGHAIFENHLPGEPLVPGVILIEALAQLAGVVLIPADGRPVHGYLGSVEHMKFRRLIRPGEVIDLSAKLDRRLGPIARFEVEASVRGEVAATGLVSIAMKDQPNSPPETGITAPVM